MQPWGFLGDVGAAVNEHAKKNGYSVVREIGGHGIGLQFHEDPWVSFVAKKGTGMVLVPGLVFTIEPMVNMGRHGIYCDEDNGWTIYTRDGKPLGAVGNYGAGNRDRPRGALLVMRMVTLTPRLAEQAAMLAYSAYARERRVVTCLPPRPAWPELGEAACLELGVAALEQNRLVGFMCAAAPLNGYSDLPMRGGCLYPWAAMAAMWKTRSSARGSMRLCIRRRPRLWVRAGAVSHAIALYAHDEALQRLFFRYGFGMRTVDAMQAIEEVPDGPLPLGFSFRELSCCEINLVEPLHRLLYQHFLCSPFFMKRDVPELAAFRRKPGILWPNKAVRWCRISSWRRRRDLDSSAGSRVLAY